MTAPTTTPAEAFVSTTGMVHTAACPTVTRLLRTGKAPSGIAISRQAAFDGIKASEYRACSICAKIEQDAAKAPEFTNPVVVAEAPKAEKTVDIPGLGEVSLAGVEHLAKVAASIKPKRQTAAKKASVKAQAPAVKAEPAKKAPAAKAAPVAQPEAKEETVPLTRRPKISTQYLVKVDGQTRATITRKADALKEYAMVIKADKASLVQLVTSKGTVIKERKAPAAPKAQKAQPVVRPVPGTVRDAVLAFLADHKGQEFTARQVMHGLGRTNGVNNILTAMAGRGQVEMTSAAPKKFTAKV